MHSTQRRYGLAALIAILASLPPLITGTTGIDSDLAYFGFGLAVLISALLGGLGPGLLATAVSAFLSAYLLLPPIFSMQIASADRARGLVLFVAEGVLLSFVGHSIRDVDNAEITDSNVRRYLKVLTFVTAAVAIKLVVGPQRPSPFSFFYAAIAVSAWSGGVVSGAAATILSSLSAMFFFLEPRYSLTVGSRESGVRVLLFMLEGVAISYFSAQRSTANQLLRKALGGIRQYALELWKSEENASALRTISRDVIWEWNLSTSPTNSGRSLHEPARTAGAPIEFTLLAQQIHPDDRVHVMTGLKSAVGDGQNEWFCDYRRRGADDEYVRVSDHAYIVRDASGNAVRVIGRSADVSGAGRTDHTVENITKYKAVFDKNPFSILLADRGLRVLEANAASCRLFGYDVNEMLHTHIEDLFHESSRGSVMQSLLELESGNMRSIMFQGTCVRSDGDSFTAKAYASMTLDHESGPEDRMIVIEQIA